MRVRKNRLFVGILSSLLGICLLGFCYQAVAGCITIVPDVRGLPMAYGCQTPKDCQAYLPTDRDFTVCNRSSLNLGLVIPTPNMGQPVFFFKYQITQLPNENIVVRLSSIIDQSKSKNLPFKVNYLCAAYVTGRRMDFRPCDMLQYQQKP